MGMPTPNTTFNFTPVRPDQYKKYEERMDELFKPHNVTFKIFRIVIASWKDTETMEMVAI